eukprot:Hpha_TRINITY_DN15811_c2_g5::TRINITY_DN15811_c2_g5_i3::g.187552::m.187552
MRVWSRWVRCVRLPNQAARRAGRRWGAVGNEEPAGEEDADGLKKGAAALSQMLSLVNAAVPRDVQAAVKSLKPTGPMSLRERTVAAVVRKAGVVGVEFNVMHETGFELDIVAPGGVVCELDGPSHRSAGRQRIAELQRKLFEKRGIVIHRVDLIQRSVVEVLDGVADACTLPNDAKSKAAWDRVRKVAREAQSHSQRLAAASKEPVQDLWVAACHYCEDKLAALERKRPGLKLKAPLRWGTGEGVDAALQAATGKKPLEPTPTHGEWEVVWEKGTAWRERPDWSARAGGGKEAFVKHKATGIVREQSGDYVRDVRTGLWLPLVAPDGNELVAFYGDVIADGAPDPEAYDCIDIALAV